MTSNFNSVLQRHTIPFPCSANVNLHYGKFNSPAALGRAKIPYQRPLPVIARDAHPARDKYVQLISKSLNFSDDVIENRCLHMMPYNEKYFHGIFEPGILISSHKQTKNLDRHKTRSVNVRNIFHHHKIDVKPAVTKSVKNKGNHLHRNTLLARKNIKTEKGTKHKSQLDSSPVFITQIDFVDKLPNIKNEREYKDDPTNFAARNAVQSMNLKCEITKQDTPVNQNGVATKEVPKLNIGSDIIQEQSKPKLHKSDWDDLLMSKLSHLTANWIVHACMPADNQKEKLEDVLQSWYGPSAHVDLVSEDSDTDDNDDDKQKDQQHKSQWKPKDASVLGRVYNITPPPPAAIDPYSENNQAPFYRQPVGIRKNKKIHDKEEAGTTNRTAHNIQVKGHVETPLPKLKDFLNPKVGNKIYDTDNLFQQEWLTGKSQVFSAEGNHDEIKMETENKYKKQLQQEMPLKSDIWYPIEKSDHSEEKGSFRKCPAHKPKNGWKRWTGLPQPVNNDLERLMTAAPPEKNSKAMETTDAKHRQKIRENYALVSIVLDWRSRWFKSGQFADSTPDDLIKDMADIQPHVRLKAIGTLAKAAEHITEDSINQPSTKELPEKIFIALECLLDDHHQQVRYAAAITLHSLDRPTNKAKEIVKEMMLSDNEADRWASVHCLAHYSTCDSDVVTEIMQQILSTQSAIKYEQGICLLAKISASTKIVHCLVAEQLNSSCWRHRVIACKILPTLSGSINRDITHKLLELMWHDWHTEVRNAAGQCLGKTSHGQDVHNSILEQLLHGTERTRLEAIRKLGQLGIMTAKLLPAFLQCFTSSFASVRCEVCITCGHLKISEEQVVSQLVHLATSDSSWRVKALAIQAVLSSFVFSFFESLGKIGTFNTEIRECLFWAMRYEDKPGVRAEACHSIVQLNIRDEDIIEALQERLLVESSATVRNEIAEALILFGVSATDDTEMVAQIKSEVRKLCHHNIIASEIIVNEDDDSKQAQLKKMICLTEEDIEALNKKKAALLQCIQSQVANKHLRHVSKPEMSSFSSITPEAISREDTDFTLAADKELEALLNHKSESCSLSSKSRPVTKQSCMSDEEEMNRRDVELIMQSPFSQAEFDEEVKKIYISGKGSNAGSREQETLRPTKFPSSLNLLPLVQSTLSKNVSSSYVSCASGLLRLSPVELHSHRLVKDKDMLKEKENFNLEVSTVFTDLDARYEFLNEDLMKIDKGYNARESLNVGDLKVCLPVEDTQLHHEKTPGASSHDEAAMTLPKNDLLEITA